MVVSGTVTPLSLAPELLHELEPDPQSTLPKVRQLYLALFGAITEGRLSAGTRLPPSRQLATRLKIGRNTVMAVYGQLADEALVSAEGRRGTRVQQMRLGDDTSIGGRAPAAAPLATLTPSPWPVSRRASGWSGVSNGWRDLAPGEPDTALFPDDAWRRACTLAARLPAAELGYRQQPLERLQNAIARYLATYRSLQVAPSQILITASTRQSLLLAASLYADPADRAWVETPGYPGAVEAFTQQGLKLSACEVDAHGLRWPANAEPPRLIYLTPCFQYPTGVALSAERRAALLAMSRTHGTILFEDDYDSEFRDDTQPRPSLAAGCGAARVLQAGTFSKILFPAARVAWLVLPDAQMPAAYRCLRAIGGGHTTVAQAAIAELLDNGTIARHLQRARQVYAGRRARLVQALQQFGSHEGLLVPLNVGAGSLSLVVALPDAASLSSLETALAEQRLGAVPLERLRWERRTPDTCKALVLGLGNVQALQIDTAVERLYRAVATVHAQTGRSVAPTHRGGS